MDPLFLDEKTPLFENESASKNCIEDIRTSPDEDFCLKTFPCDFKPLGSPVILAKYGFLCLNHKNGTYTIICKNCFRITFVTEKYNIRYAFYAHEKTCPFLKKFKVDEPSLDTVFKFSDFITSWMYSE